MTNPLVKLFCGVCSCIRGSLRVILFFLCLVFVLLQTLNILGFYSESESGQFVKKTFMDKSAPAWPSYLINFSLLALSLLGTYGAFYNHQRSLKIFALFLAIFSILIGSTILVYLKSDRYTEKNDIIIQRLKNSTHDYDWTHKGVPVNKDSTIFWDLVQSQTKCCGMDSYKDWDKVRPSDVPNNVYPTSCCGIPREGVFCPKDAVYKDGCKDRMELVELFVLALAFIYLAFMFLLSIIAYILTFPDCSNSGRESSEHRSMLPQQDYQRFDGSVYVRQPSVSPHYQHQQPPKVSAPPMYPDLYHADKKSGPPSY